MTVLLGIDDTDMPDTPGTGRIARAIAARLSGVCSVTGVTRHQLFVHPDIPYTSHNSCAVIHCEAGDAHELFSFARDMVSDGYVEGSDPGIAAADSSNLGPSVVAFGLDAKRIILTQQQARSIAGQHGILLEGIGGTYGGIIGALAGIGLASTGNDGRFVLKGGLRDLANTQEASVLLEKGVDLILTLDGRQITEGRIHFKKFPKPSFIRGKSVLFVNPVNGGYHEVVRD
jgi:Predicted DNA-binding protein containing a Zn-ribbon domain